MKIIQAGLLAFFLTILASSWSAHAQDAPFEKILGEWRIRGSNGECIMSREYPGEATFYVVHIFEQKKSFFALATPNIKIEPGKNYPLKMWVRRYLPKTVGYDFQAQGAVIDGEPMVLWPSSEQSEALLMEGVDKGMYISGSGFALDGYAEAYDAMRVCSSTIQGVAIEEHLREKWRRSFPRTPGWTLRPVWEPMMQNAYFPFNSTAAPRVVAMLDINREGAVTGCRITIASGDDRFNRATCNGLQRFGRFTPALDAAGNPVAGTLTILFQWNREYYPPDIPHPK